jgi:hypothetical protein
VKFISGIKNIAQAVVNNDVRHGKVHSIDFDHISVVMENTTTVIHNVQVVGNPEKLAPGDKVTVVMVKTRPVAITEDAAQLLAEVAPHAETHGKDGIDPITPEAIGASPMGHAHAPDPVDDLPEIPSLRSLGIGPQQAAAGDHIHATSGGDMLKSTYDTDSDGIVESAENADTVDGLHAKASGADAHILATGPSGAAELDGGLTIKAYSSFIELGDSSLSGSQPYIDFHYGAGGAQDYNARIINQLNKLAVWFANGNLGTFLVSGILEATVGVKFGGSTFPTFPTAGELFFRTDLGYWCYWDGSRWLTANEYHVHFPYTVYSASGNNQLAQGHSNRAILVTRVAMRTNVVGTNNASNYWTGWVRSLNPLFQYSTDVYSFNTYYDAGSVWVSHEGNPSVAAPTYYGGFDVNIFKSGAPGNLTILGAVYYRLIVT